MKDFGLTGRDDDIDGDATIVRLDGPVQREGSFFLFATTLGFFLSCMSYYHGMNVLTFVVVEETDGELNAQMNRLSDTRMSRPGAIPEPKVRRKRRGAGGRIGVVGWSALTPPRASEARPQAVH